MAIPMGQLIVPTSVSAGSGATATVSASGKVTFSNLTTSAFCSVNGVFSSTYDNYLIVIKFTTNGAQGYQMRLRASGTDTTSGYVWQRIIADGSSVSGLRQTGAGNIQINLGSTTTNGSHVYVYGPNLAQPTAVRSVSVSGNSGGYILDGAGTQSGSTQFDGFTIEPSSSDSDGTLCVYGLSQ